MPRKSVAVLKKSDKIIADAVEDFEAVSEIKYEIARDEYEAQDAETRVVIDGLVTTLKQYATGSINVSIGGEAESVAVSPQYMDYNLLWLAIELVKDLAFVGIQIAGFTFSPHMCAQCGVEILKKRNANA